MGCRLSLWVPEVQVQQFPPDRRNSQLCGGSAAVFPQFWGDSGGSAQGCPYLCNFSNRNLLKGNHSLSSLVSLVILVLSCTEIQTSVCFQAFILWAVIHCSEISIFKELAFESGVMCWPTYISCWEVFFFIMMPNIKLLITQVLLGIHLESKSR